jgi:hypothetical protein
MGARFLTLGAAALLLHCGSGETPPVFGGQGAGVRGPNEIPLQKGEGEVASGPCAKPAPADSRTVLEDFEDGDNHLFKVFERDGWWFTATDDTGGMVQPPPDLFKPARLSDAETTTENRYAAHFVASGFTDWGVVWGTTLEWRREGVSCPYNASQFAGLKLRARGQGRMRVNLGIPETFPVDNRGSCTKGCYDTHGKVIELTPEWTDYTISFDMLQQGGWGTEARFDAERLLALNFNANPEWQPVDLWIDDLQWLTTTATSAVTSPLAPSQSPAAEAAPESASTPAPTSSAPPR